MEIDLERPCGNEDRLDIEDCEIINDTGEILEEVGIGHGKSNKHGQVNTESNWSKNNIFTEDEGVTCASGGDFNMGITKYEPQNGLEFESKEAAYSFYREYARSVGFGITIKASRRSKSSGKFIDVKIACSRFGNKPESGKTVNPRSCPKTGCKASMHIKRKSDGYWFISSIVKEHNHEICPDDFHYAIRGRNKEPGGATSKKKGLKILFGEADVQVLLENLTLLQAGNPGFWYSIDLDQDKRMRSLMWVDAKGRKDYKDFSDAIILDTHYVRNKYRVPFVPIIGINHHFQPILLGCALIGDETSSSYVWLLRTWLKAVGGQSPGVIMTDQDKALKEAISEVFPDSRHCFCLWHVLGKIPEKLSYVINRFNTFTAEFKECISRAWTEEEFERGWSKMVEKFELRKDVWLQSLYEDRKKWVPTYMREIFFAGLCTAERSESISSLFDSHLNKETTTKEFIEHYKGLMHNCYEEEARADFQTLQRQPMLRSHVTFEKQVSTVYTHAIFEKFQAEVLGILACNVEKACQGETTISFRVDEFEHQNYMVTWNEMESNVCCSCHTFEYRGFLCRHALAVLQKCGIRAIPVCYILKRWTRNAKTRQVNSGSLNSLHYRGQRFDDICRNVVKLIEEGSLSQESYNVVFWALEEALKQCTSVNEYETSVLKPKTQATQMPIGEGKQVTEAEASSVRLQENSVQEQPILGTHSVDIPCDPQHSFPVMSLDPRTSDHSGSCGALQRRRGVEQLNTIYPMHDGYYSDQRVMQGLVEQMHSIPTGVGSYGSKQGLQELLLGQFNFTTAPTMHGALWNPG